MSTERREIAPDLTQRDLDICVALRREADSMGELMEAIRSDAERVTMLFKQIPGGSGVSDRVGSSSVKLADIETLYKHKIQQRLEHVMAVEAAIERVSDATCRGVLRLRYIEGLKWDEIPKRVGYERSRCFELHAKALLELGIKRAD